MPMARTWHGLELREKIHRAGGRSIVSIGVHVASDGKRLTHKISGTLARSIHVAPLDAHHDDDEARAVVADLMLSGEGPVRATETEMGPTVEVGSWLPYACVEWVGRQHPGITQAIENVRGARADAIVAQAWREEGLA